MIERILTLLAPYIAVLAGLLADWLLVRVHVLGVFRDRTGLVMDITQIIIWGLTALMVWASSSGLLQRRQERSAE